MSLEMRVEKLESEMLQVRKMLHQKDDNQHQIWNDLQQELLSLSRQNSERLDRMEARQDRMEARQDRMEARIDKVESHLDRIDSRLNRIESDVATLTSDMSDVKGMLQTLLDRQ